MSIVSGSMVASTYRIMSSKDQSRETSSINAYVERWILAVNEITQYGTQKFYKDIFMLM